MTSKEALELLKGAGANLIEPYNSQVIEILEKLVERDTPKKPIMSEHNYMVCPNCNGSGIKNNGDNDFELDFCSLCGQRLSWNEYDEK